MNTKILLVEDDHGISEPLSLYLAPLGFAVTTAANGLEALDLFASLRPDLVVLDINLPEMDGFSVCEKIREIDSTPIVMLSARDGEDDKVRALELGADDYVSKPFSPRELVARIQAIRKRFVTASEENKAGSHNTLSLGRLSLDLPNYSVRIGDVPVKITRTEFLILTYLVRNKDHVIERERLMKDIMGYEHYLYDRTIDTHMKNIRHKLGEAISIETVRGVGYRVEAKQ